MTDCPLVEVREMLPDYIHESLGDSERARVDAHLAVCRVCTEELGVLRSAHQVMSRLAVPFINTAAIVAALPRPRALRPVGPVRRRSSTLIRLAAAISFISLGGISVGVARSYFRGTASIIDRSAASIGGAATSAAVPVAGSVGSAGVTPSITHVLSVYPSISELGDAELESLLGELDRLEAVPMSEPEATPGGRTVAGSIIGS